MIIIVRGLPAPQGSKRHVGKGIMVESSKNVKPWREAVKQAVLTACGIGGESSAAVPGIAGPVEVSMTFTMPKPKSAKRGAVPSSRPDLSKLVRSTEDALTDVGAWEDDARVVRCVAAKVFPGEGSDSLGAPGAVIRIKQAVFGV